MMVGGASRWQNDRAMNKNKRFFLGLISSLLFAVGFARAAEHFDPMTQSRANGQVNISGVAPDCLSACAINSK